MPLEASSKAHLGAPEWRGNPAAVCASPRRLPTPPSASLPPRPPTAAGISTMPPPHQVPLRVTSETPPKALPPRALLMTSGPVNVQPSLSKPPLLALLSKMRTDSLSGALHTPRMATGGSVSVAGCYGKRQWGLQAPSEYSAGKRATPASQSSTKKTKSPLVAPTQKMMASPGSGAAVVGLRPAGEASLAEPGTAERGIAFQVGPALVASIGSSSGPR